MWQIVPIEVEQTLARIWVGRLDPGDFDAPVTSLEFRLRWIEIGAQVQMPVEVPMSGGWSRPLPGYPRGLIQIVNLRGLEPGRCYRLELQSRPRGTRESAWQGAAAPAWIETLPAQLPTGTWQAAFRVMVGSCFANVEDGDQTTGAFEQLWADPGERPALKLLVGDQVYLDIGLPILRLSTEQIHARVLSHYAQTWRALAGMFERGGTWMLPDDHEYHNNYPYQSGIHNPYLCMNRGYRSAWTKVALAAVRNIQQTRKVRFFGLGDDLSFCVLDVRSERLKRNEGFTDPASLTAVLQWLRGLKGPGVLVMSQPLMRNPGRRTDRNLASFRGQYSALVEAIAACGHDVVVLAGDVHFSRVCDVKFARGKRLIEIASSPMSNLTKLHALASARVPDRKPASFPPITIDGVASARVNYRRQSSTERRNWTYPRTRSVENFVTVAFLRGRGGVQMRVKAWRLGPARYAGALPAVDFDYEYVIS